MSQFEFLHFQNFQHLTGLDREFARFIELVLGNYEVKTGGGVSDLKRAVLSSGLVRLPDSGVVRVQFDQESDTFSYWFDQLNPEENRTYPGEEKQCVPPLMIVLKAQERREIIVLPLGAIVSTQRNISHLHQVYAHTFIHDETGASIADEFAYIGVTRRGWRTRWVEHVRAAERGSRYRFHQAIRALGSRAKTIQHYVIAAGLSETKAMELEEVMVGHETLYPRGLNMIPGGYAGIEYLRKIGAAGPHERVTPDDKHEIINRFFERTSRRGLPNPLAAAMWQDAAYAEKVICGPEDRLKPDQIRTARFLSSLGKDVEEIASEISARNTQQVRRLLSGDTYSRVA